ncbi:MAG TPA: hypothetical protein VGJ60_24960 [Chloroflexota bacterium]
MSISSLWRSRPSEAGPRPALRLRAREDALVVPEIIEFPPAGKLRIGYHPPYMDRHVGRADFSRLPFVDIRGNSLAVRDLSRHAACIWRDASGGCYVQLGWPGPGESVQPRAQSRVLRFGRQHDAASRPLRLEHRDVLRLGASVEYVFVELADLLDRTTPEQKKLEQFEASIARAAGSA